MGEKVHCIVTNGWHFCQENRDIAIFCDKKSNSRAFFEILIGFLADIPSEIFCPCVLM